MDSTEALPDDALANILRRRPACDLAASRCVRKAWCAVVDAHQLLLPHVLPHAVCSLFVNYIDYERPRFFARPSAERPAINGDLGFLPGYNKDFEPIVDHCNGLLIYGSEGRGFCVVNPATRRWERLPRPDAKIYNRYLVFDPAVSPHYEVLAMVIPVQPLPDKKPSKSKKQAQFCLTELFSLLEDTPEVLTNDLEEDCEDGHPELSRFNSSC
ncbi:unnamed protein product [Alopecurus aequalis]